MMECKTHAYIHKVHTSCSLRQFSLVSFHVCSLLRNGRRVHWQNRMEKSRCRSTTTLLKIITRIQQTKPIHSDRLDVQEKWPEQNWLGVALLTSARCWSFVFIFFYCSLFICSAAARAIKSKVKICIGNFKLV